MIQQLNEEREREEKKLNEKMHKTKAIIYSQRTTDKNNIDEEQSETGSAQFCRVNRIISKNSIDRQFHVCPNRTIHTPKKMYF